MNAHCSDDHSDNGLGDLQGVLRDAVLSIRQASFPHEHMTAILDRAASWQPPVTKQVERRTWMWAALVAGTVALLATIAIMLNNQGMKSSLVAVDDQQPSQTPPKTMPSENQRGVEKPAANPSEQDGAVAVPKAGAFGGQPARPTGGVALGGLGAGASPSRSFAVASQATVIVSTGGEKPIKLGEQQPFSRENRLHVWDWSKGKESRPLEIEAGNFAVSPDGKTIVTHDGQTIDIETSKVERLPEFDAEVQRVKFSPDGKTLVLQIGRPVGIESQATIRLLDFPGGKKRVDIPEQFVYMFDVAFTPDGRQLAVMSKDMSIRRFDATSGKEMMKYDPPHTNSIRSIAISPDGDRIASSGPKGEIFLWELKTGKLIGKLNVRYPNFSYDDEVQALAFSPDSKLLVGTGLVRMVLWNAADGEVEHLYKSWQSGSARHVRFAKDGAEITTIHGFAGTRDDAGRNVLVYPTVNTWPVERK